MEHLNVYINRVILILQLIFIVAIMHVLRIADRIAGHEGVIYHIEYVDMEHVRLTPTEEK